MDISVDDISQDGDELELGVSVGGYHEVELEESDTVSVSIDEILGKIDNDRLLDHVGAAGILAYAKEHDIKLESDSTEINAEALEKWVRDDTDNLLTALRIVHKALLG